jgi:iron complex outermembrane recepter protein
MRRWMCASVVVLSVGARAMAQAPSTSVSVQDLKRLTIEELASLDVTSVSRRSERVSRAAAAVSVVRAEDIRRSGATTLPDILRLADGLDVARANANAWGVTSRGFNSSSANKLLVLVDGRSVYSPLSSGTFWDVQDFSLADIDRIEVIRGPGGSIWGANAVNGVVNVLTRSAADTIGDFVGVASGSDEHVLVNARHGGRFGDGGAYRVYGKLRQRGPQLFAATDTSAEDDILMGAGGFRMDSDARSSSFWTVQGDAYSGSVGLFNRDDARLAGGNVLGRWSRRWSGTAEFRVQGSYERTWRKVPLQFEETRDTVDVDAQHHLLLRGRNDVVVGGAVRVSNGNDRGTAGFVFEPERRTHTVVGLFAQDEIALRGRDLFLTLGSKFERNDFTGMEVQPTARFRWTPGDRRTVWAAVSRAVRLPTRFDTDIRVVNPVTHAVLIEGNEDFDAESVVAYEGGFRTLLSPRFAVDTSVYANRYDRLRSQEFHPGQPLLISNGLNATTGGLEIAGTAQALASWRLHAAYSFIHENFSFDPGVVDPTGGAFEHNDPAHLFSLLSYLDLPHGLQFDGTFRSVSRRPNPVVPAYSEMTLRLGWTVRAGWEVALVGTNLLHSQHAELFTINAPRYEYRRGVYARSAWRF